MPRAGDAALRGERGERVLRWLRVRQPAGLDPQLVHASSAITAVATTSVSAAVAAAFSASTAPFAASACAASAISPSTIEAAALAAASFRTTA